MADIIDGYILPPRFWWAASGTTSLGVPAAGVSGARIAWLQGGRAITYQVQYQMRRRYSPSGYATAGRPSAQQWEDWGPWTDPENAVGRDAASTTSQTANVIFWDGHPFTFSGDVTTYDMYQVNLRVRVFDQDSLTASEWAFCSFDVVMRPVAALSALPNASGGYTVTVQLTGWQRGRNTVTINESKYCMENMRGQNLGPWWVNGPWYAGTTAQVGVETGTKTFDVPAAAVSFGRIYSETLQVVTADGGECIIDPSNIYPFDCAADSHARNPVHTADELVYMIPVGPHSDPPGVDVPTVTATPDGDGNLLVAVTGGTWDGVAAWYTWTDARGAVRHEAIQMAQDGAGWAGVVVAPPFDVPIEISATARTGSDWVQRSTEAEVPSAGAIELRAASGGESVRILYNARDQVQRRYEAEAEAVKTAGAYRPKSRYGTGGAMSLGITGLCALEGVTGGWLEEHELADFARLEAGEDWLLRLPGGERYRVALMSYTLNNSPSPGFVELGLDLQVVADGLD